MKYDVIVVGGGPAGSSAAYFLSKKGFNVALVDKKKFPRDKLCGGAFSPNLVRSYPDLFENVSSVIEATSKEGVIHSTNLKIALAGKVSMFTVLRYKFDNFLFNRAKDVGATTIETWNAKEIKIRQNEVIVSNRKDNIYGKIAIIAEGASGTLAEKLGIRKHWSKKELIVSFANEIHVGENVVEDIYGTNRSFHFYINFGNKPGYAWIFPKKEHINIGLGTYLATTSEVKETYRGFIKFLMTKKYLPKIEMPKLKAAMIPIRGPPKQTFGNRVLLVGDSAGMVSPITGGGIKLGIISAKIASETISRLHNLGLDFNEENLSLYEKIWKRKLLKKFKSELIVQKIFTSSFVDALFRIGASDEKLQKMTVDMLSEDKKVKPKTAAYLLRVGVALIKGTFHI